MTILEQRLTKLAEKLADEYSTSISGPIPIHKVGFEIGFKAGAASMIPIIMKAVAQRDMYASGNRSLDEEYQENEYLLKELEDFINKQGE